MARITPDQAARKIRDQADKAFRALVLEASRRIVLRTPVDTGRARGNWQISVNTASVTPTEQTDKNGSVTLFQISGKVDAADRGDVVYLLNGLPYIIELERGSSKQNPAGMVGITVAELQPMAKQVAARIRRLQ